MKKTLTDRALKAAKPAEPGKRYTLWDGLVPSFGARVTDKGHISFIVMRRLDGKLIRRGLGDYGSVTLEEARDLARSALRDIGKGVDPKVTRSKERTAREQAERNSFAAVADAFLAEHVASLRSAREIEGVVNAMKARWGARPITEIARANIAEAVREIAKTTPYAARKFFAYTSSLFNWAIAQERYGLTVSPCFVMKPEKLGAKVALRQHTLSDDDLRVFWRATAATGYPFGPLARFLLLTAQRRDEAADASWSEIDLDKKLWTIPAERMKADAPHVVPLSAEAVALLESLPRFAGKDRKGDFVFTTTAGERPVSGFSKAKSRLDAKMVELLRKDAAKAGENPAGVTLADWRLHDLRRTARTHFSAIPSQDMVRELAIAHTRPGLHKVYDQHLYADEKRALFDAWARRLMAIVEPGPGGNVIELRSVANV